ncbi:hypothetical protein FQR65_LT19665 [Abscondita terminalis]|nr:hypothetical protein FQR65_LT19665 [Abscondita terminalis]
MRGRFARHRGKTGTLHLLQEEIFRLEKAIETDHKLKHMAELQQSVVGDSDTRQQLAGQVVQWEENLERLHCEQFRLRCYMASLQSGELPNPKSLLTHVSRATKNTLNKLGVFTVSSFHAFICARSPSLLNNLLAGRGATKRRPPMLSRSNSGSSRRSLQMNSRDESEKTVKVTVPDSVSVTVYVREGMSVEEFLTSACTRKNLNPTEHFVRVKKRREMEDHNYFVPHRSDLIETYVRTSVAGSEGEQRQGLRTKKVQKAVNQAREIADTGRGASPRRKALRRVWKVLEGAAVGPASATGVPAPWKTGEPIWAGSG